VSDEYPLAIDVAHLDRMRREAAAHLVVDVREGWELGLSALDGSLHMPLAELPARWRELPPRCRQIHKAGA
jgi:rhodanese-related sulfurtransferase